MLACSSISASTKKILVQQYTLNGKSCWHAVPSRGQGIVSLQNRAGDAAHQHVKVLLDEAEVGDVEGEVLHEASGDGVGVGGRQKHILLGVDTGKCPVQIFQNFDLTKNKFCLLDLIAFTLTSWLIIAVSQETKTTLLAELRSSMMKAREKVRMWMPASFCWALS